MEEAERRAKALRHMKFLEKLSGAVKSLSGLLKAWSQEARDAAADARRGHTKQGGSEGFRREVDEKLESETRDYNRDSGNKKDVISIGVAGNNGRESGYELRFGKEVPLETRKEWAGKMEALAEKWKPDEKTGYTQRAGFKGDFKFEVVYVRPRKASGGR